MSKQRTNTTRVQSVRFNSKQLAEVMLFFRKQKGWRIESIGGFLRDVYEVFHNILSDQEGFEHLENSAEAEEILQQFQSGRVNWENLSLTISQERLGGDDPFYRPQTKHEDKNRRRRSIPTANDTTMKISDWPQDIDHKYQMLDDTQKGLIGGLVQLGHSWDSIRKEVDRLIDASSKQSTEDAMKVARSAGMISDSENENELPSDEENDPEAIKQHRQQVDKEQEEQLKEAMGKPPSDIVSGSESDE